MRVLLVDDHPLFREALAATVAKIGPDVVIEQYDTLAGVKAALVGNPDASLVLLDLKLPDSQGTAGLLALKAHFPRLPIAIISANDDVDTVQTAIACGAAGFVSKSARMEELTAAVEALALGETWFPDTAREPCQGILSASQARILDGVHRGLMNKQIAWELGLSEATIKYHLTGIFRKMGVVTRAQLLALSRDRAPPSA